MLVFLTSQVLVHIWLCNIIIKGLPSLCCLWSYPSWLWIHSNFREVIRFISVALTSKDEGEHCHATQLHLCYHNRKSKLLNVFLFRLIWLSFHWLCNCAKVYKTRLDVQNNLLEFCVIVNNFLIWLLTTDVSSWQIHFQRMLSNIFVEMDILVLTQKTTYFRSLWYITL